MTTPGRTAGRTFKALARANVASATPLLLRAMGKGRKAAKTRAIAFGFQVVLGTLVNAILNDPGPLSLHDREMETRLAGLPVAVAAGGDGRNRFTQAQTLVRQDG